MLPRHARSEGASRLKFLESELFVVGGFVLGIVPLRPPAGIVFRHLEVEVFDVWVHLAAKTISLEWQRAPNNKNSVPQRPVGFNPQETFTERDEARNVEDGIGIQIVERNPISKKEDRRGKDAEEETSPAARRQ
jgi:hypothetical protein